MLSKQVVCFKILHFLLGEPAVKLHVTSHNTWSLEIPLLSSVHFVTSNFHYVLVRGFKGFLLGWVFFMRNPFHPLYLLPISHPSSWHWWFHSRQWNGCILWVWQVIFFLPAFPHSSVCPLTFPFFPANSQHILFHNSLSQDVLEHLFIFLLFLCFLDRFINILAVVPFHVCCSLSHSHSCMLPVRASDPGQYYQLSTTTHSWILWVVEFSHLRCRGSLGLAVLLGEVHGCAAFGASSALKIALVLYKISSTPSSCVPTFLGQKVQPAGGLPATWGLSWRWLPPQHVAHHPVLGSAGGLTGPLLDAEQPELLFPVFESYRKK